jgi:hypothetical protein
MAKKKFVLRIDEPTMKAIEKWAADEFRSVNGQIEFLLTKALRTQRRLKGKPKEADET